MLKIYNETNYLVNRKNANNIQNFERKTRELTLPIKTDLAFLKLLPSFSYSGASFLQCPHLLFQNREGS